MLISLILLARIRILSTYLRYIGGFFMLLKILFSRSDMWKLQKINPNILWKLLLTCTTAVPFHDHLGNIYVRTDGVSMGSFLGPIFSNFYMSDLENRVKQSTLGLNRDLSSNFWWLSCANHVKFTEECVMCTKKNVFAKKCLQINSTWVCFFYVGKILKRNFLFKKLPLCNILICRCIQKHIHNNKDERTQFFRKIYLSLYLKGFERVTKGIICERWVGDWTELQHIDPPKKLLRL